MIIRILRESKRLGLLKGLNSIQAERLIAFTLGFRSKSTSVQCSIQAAKNPISKGHALITSRAIRRLDDLTLREFQDVFRKVREVENIVDADAFNISIKDGEAAGQAIPNFHVHVVPRNEKCSIQGDAIYDLIDNWTPTGEKNKNKGAPMVLPKDSERRPRTVTEMRSEACAYRELTKFEPESEDDTLKFGPHTVLVRDQVFYKSNHSFALVNLKPLQVGHVLVCPLRSVDRIQELHDEEINDLAASVLKVRAMLHKEYGALGFNIGIQDGKIAGQSVPHVHVHLIPRGRQR
jgi:diadenosine tetraphosphate (Ap4A) HIT family hydrolase